MAASETPGAGLRAIVLYKTIKAVLQLAAALALAALWPLGLPAELRDLAMLMRQHTTHGWAIQLAALLERGSTGHGVALGILALGLDGTLTGVEAWALRRGRWWGAWLVVLATGSLLPFELYEFARAPHASRALLIGLELIIVAYLARRARQHGRDRASAEGG